MNGRTAEFLWLGIGQPRARFPQMLDAGAFSRNTAAEHLPTRPQWTQQSVHLYQDWPANETPRDEGMDNARYDRGLAMRRKVLGDAYVNRAVANADDFNQKFQKLLTEY